MFRVFQPAEMDEILIPLAVLNPRYRKYRGAVFRQDMERLVRADENPFPFSIKLIVAITSKGYGLSGSWSKERSDRVPGKIDRVHAVRADQAAVVCLTGIPTDAVAKLSVEAFPRAHAGRSKTVRAETTNELMIGPVESDQGGPRPGRNTRLRFLAWNRSCIRR